MKFFTLLSPIIYWILIILWAYIFSFYVKGRRKRLHKDKLISILFTILAIDAFRTLFESFYFGAWYTSLAGFLPTSVYKFLIHPDVVFVPKLLNLIAAIVIITILIYRWIPQEEN